jgi:N-acylneuraminate cytidylyltransferase
MTSLAIVPARGGSKRIKEKNIADFCGKPLMAYSIEAAQQSNLFSLIHVSTDSEKIRNIATTLRTHVEFPRPTSLADDHTGIIPVLRWVVREFLNRGLRFDDVCMLMPTAPLITCADLAAAYEVFQQHQCKVPVVAVASYPVPIEWAYELEAGTYKLTRMFPEKMTNIRSQDLASKFYDAGAFAFFETEQLLDESYDLGSQLVGYPLPRYRVVDIDNCEDLAFAEILYKGRVESKKVGNKLDFGDGGLN